jgi:hypothetical protein
MIMIVMVIVFAYNIGKSEIKGLVVTKKRFGERHNIINSEILVVVLSLTPWPICCLFFLLIFLHSQGNYSIHECNIGHI